MFITQAPRIVKTLSNLPESHDFRTPIEIPGMSQKFLYGEREIYITALRKRFLSKDNSYPVMMLKIGDFPFVFACRINAKFLPTTDIEKRGIYNYICGHKCTPKNFIRGCKFDGKFQSILTDNQKDPRYWTVENWKIYSINKIHNCEIHVQNLCACLNKSVKKFHFPEPNSAKITSLRPKNPIENSKLKNSFETSVEIKVEPSLL